METPAQQRGSPIAVAVVQAAHKCGKLRHHLLTPASCRFDKSAVVTQCCKRRSMCEQYTSSTLNTADSTDNSEFSVNERCGEFRIWKPEKHPYHEDACRCCSGGTKQNCVAKDSLHGLHKFLERVCCCYYYCYYNCCSSATATAATTLPLVFYSDY